MGQEFMSVGIHGDTATMGYSMVDNKVGGEVDDMGW